MGVFIGVVVLLISLGLVALMMWSEWSNPSEAQPLAEKSAPLPKARPKARKAAAVPKKKAAKKKK